MSFYLKQDDSGNYEINSGSNNKDVFKEDDLGKLLDYKRLVERVGDYSQGFQIQLFDGIDFILAQEQEHYLDLGDVKISIRENKINYNKDLTDILEFFQQHNIQLPDGQSEDYFKLIVEGSIFGSENLSNLRAINERIGADFKYKKDLLMESYRGYVEALNQTLDNKINEKHRKLSNLINASSNDLEREYMSFTGDNNSGDNNSFINYKKGYLDYLNNKIIENLENNLRDRLRSNVNNIYTLHNKSANDLKDYIMAIGMKKMTMTILIVFLALYYWNLI